MWCRYLPVFLHLVWLVGREILRVKRTLIVASCTHKLKKILRTLLKFTEKEIFAPHSQEMGPLYCLKSLQ